jgi:DNA polymerase III delta prime subunit
MLFKDRYTPYCFDDYKIHRKIISKLRNITEDPPNLLFYGKEGIGKSTMVNCFLNEMFNTKIEITKKTVKLKINNISKELEINSSIYHFEINLTKYSLLNNRNYLCELLKLLVSYQEINKTCPYKIIVIKNAHHINHSLIYFKNIIEKYSKVRFILTTTCITHKLINLTKLCTLITLKQPPLEEINKFCNTIIENEKFNKPTTKLLKDIVKEKNFNHILIKLEIVIQNKSKYIDPIKKEIENLYILLMKPSINSIIKIRELIYSLISKNIDIEIIIKQIYTRLINNKNMEIQKKKEITKQFAEYDTRIKKSFKNVIHIETLLIILLKIIHY